MDALNFTNSNDVFPIIDLIRRELQKSGIFSASNDMIGAGGQPANIPQEPVVISMEALREMPGRPSLVTKVLYTYDTGMKETLNLYRDNNLIISGFLIEIDLPVKLNAQMEEEQIGYIPFTAIRGNILRENGLFKNLQLEYVRAV